MKKTVILLVVIGFSIQSFSQDIVLSNTLKSTEDVRFSQYEALLDGSQIQYGKYTGEISISDSSITSRGSYDIVLGKVDKNFHLEWIVTLGGSGVELDKGLIVTEDESEIYISGGYNDTCFFSEIDYLVSSGSMDAFIAKYSSSGEFIWAKTVISGPGINRIENMCLDGDKLGVLGYSKDTTYFNDGSFDNDIGTSILICQFDLDGNHLLNNQIASNDFIASRSIVASTSGYLVTGYYRGVLYSDVDTITSETSNSDIYIYAVDSDLKGRWLRKINSNTPSVGIELFIDSDDNHYTVGNVGGVVYMDSTAEDSITIDLGRTDRDYIIVKYDINGSLMWYDINGGQGNDILVSVTMFNNEIIAGGYFTDTIAINKDTLVSNGVSDKDGLLVYYDLEGNRIKGRSVHGSGSYTDEITYLSANSDNLFISGNTSSPVFNIGDSTYINENPGINNGFIAKYGCKTISIDNTIDSDISGCFGDSTGSIQLTTSGGFGSPWAYSIDNNETSQGSPYFPNLPAGEYQVVVIDKGGCEQTGQLVSLSQPELLELELISSTDITVTEDGSIVVGAQGGTSPYTYTLMPDNVLQGYGTFIFARGDSGRYVVQLNDGNLCGPVSTDTIWIQDLSSVGINDLGGLMLRVFPNPATDVVTVEMPMEAAEVSMEVLSLTGQIVLSKRAYTTGGVLRETINVSDLADGMYMLRLNGETLKSAFVVN